MSDLILWILVVLGIANAGLIAMLLARSSASRSTELNLRDELRGSREEAASAARESRDELTARLDAANTMLAENLRVQSELQRAQLEGVTIQLKALGDSNAQSLEGIRTTFDARVKALQESNEKKLDDMRRTVDEKLHVTLEKRLGESFELVSKQLQAVQRGSARCRIWPLASGTSSACSPTSRRAAHGQRSSSARCSSRRSPQASSPATCR
jgi:DNA recombination protein RmuC